MTSQSHDRTPRRVLAAFSGPSLPFSALSLPVVISLPEYYASTVGLPLTVVGATFMGVRLLDIGFDPIVGGVMDRTTTRFGRFRVWMVAATPVLMIATYMLFNAARGASSLYLWIWLAAMYGAYSIATLAQSAWGSVLSASYHERSRIYAWWQGGNIIGMLRVLTMPILAARLGFVGSGAGVHAMGWFVIIALPLTVGLSALVTPEPRQGGSGLPPLAKALVQAANLARRPAVARILIADLFLSLAPGVTGALFLFFFRSKGFTTLEAQGLLLVYFIGGLVGAGLWVSLSHRIGKHHALLASCAYYALVQSGMFLLPKLPMIWAAASLFVAGLSYAASQFLLRALMADAGDEARLDTGSDFTGLLFALVSSTTKLGYAIAVGVSFIGLGLVGFKPEPGALNAPGAVEGLQSLFGFAPPALALLGAVAVWRYPLTLERHAEIRAALAQAPFDDPGPIP